MEVVSGAVPDPVAAPATIEVALCNGHRVSVTGSFDVEVLSGLVEVSVAIPLGLPIIISLGI